MGTLPASATSGEYDSAKRFQDLIFDLRIVLLQDIAVLKCCNAPTLHRTEVGSILASQLFNTPDFARYCEQMQIEAGEEIGLLRHDLELAMSDGEHYGDVSRSPGSAFYGTGQPMQYVDDLSGRGATLPPIHSQRRVEGSMMAGSPDRESFSPTISPSPLAQDPRSASLNPTPLMDGQYGINIPRQHTPYMANQQPQTHSLPTRSLDGWSDSYLNGGDNGMSGGLGEAGPSSIGGMAPSAKRPRPEVGSRLISPSAVTMPRPKSPYSKKPSPKGNWRPLQSLSGSLPKPTRSPLGGNMGSSSYRVGPPLSSVKATTKLPSISQFAPPASGVLPLPIDNPVFARGYAPDQLQRSGAPHRREAADPHMLPGSLRRSSDSVGEESSFGGVGDTTVTGRDELSLSEQEQITFLREENAYLKQRLHQLEISVSQRQAEVESRIARMEQFMTRSNEHAL
ncbi:hypothetical protein IWW37_003271 [Coemansia sp. RSA 2050]|nr:hypothetical protein IWW37_003271 [Coemansia sp. RSA 2050]KAJ2733198.1 hypothetical protein IW152_003270 [Coemansia sp. BCRC 34962]